MKDNLFMATEEETVIHRLSGLSKLLAFLFLSFTVMFTFDPRIITFVLILSFIFFRMARIRYSQVRLMFIYLAVFIGLNIIFTFIFSPEEGVKIYGSRHVIFSLTDRYTLTQEQVFYQLVKTLKFIAVIPLGIVFLFTTNPTEFAASLNRIGLGYKSSYAVSLTLRYLPEVIREYKDISKANQARGLAVGKKVKFSTRIKNSLTILIPLIFSSLDKIENISQAMDLRGFGKHKTRTWYNYRELEKYDYLTIGFSLLIFIISILISVFINKSRFYNPFI